MGSQFGSEARPTSESGGSQKEAESEVLQSFSDYLRQMTPLFAVSTPTPMPRLAAMDRQARFREEDREAMHFYSESQMR